MATFANKTFSEMDWNARFFDPVRTFRVLVIGDVMVDRYLWGSVDRISPEAPVPVMLLRQAENRLGGAANVAVNLAGLGASVGVIGCAGDDEKGRLISELCTRSSIDCRGLRMISGWPTTTKTRVISGSQHLLRVDDEAPLNDEEAQEQLVAAFSQEIASRKPDAIVLQDYNKGVLTSELIRHILITAAEKQIPVSVDPKAENFLEFSGVSLFKPNLRELRAQVPFTVEPETESLHRATAYLRDRMEHGLTCVTLSDRGLFIDSGDHAEIYPTKEQHVVDVCGAGDAVISVLTLARLCDLPPGQMAQLANVAGGLVCEEIGVSPVPLERLQQDIVVKSFS